LPGSDGTLDIINKNNKKQYRNEVSVESGDKVSAEAYFSLFTYHFYLKLWASD
jgi:hypothetical protein